MPDGMQEVPAERQSQPCLDEGLLHQLGELGRRIEAVFGAPRDVEWARGEGGFWILQARPITAVTAAEREQVRREEIARLQTLAAPGGTVWSRYNLAEVLPEPTPMTWAVIQELLSGRGGFGRMYRDLGFEPAPELAGRGIYDLVCGRPYCNLSREPGLYANGLPFEHPFAELKQAPDRAVYPRAVPNWSRAGWRFWLFLPLVFWKSVRVAARLQRQMIVFGRHFREHIVPAFDADVRRGLGQDLAVLDDAALLERLNHGIERVLVEFARDSLKPTVLAAALLDKLEKALVRLLGAGPGRSALKQLTLGIRLDPETDVARAIRQVAEGRLQRDQFLERFGHRGDQEMELSRPRWSDDPAALDRLFSATGLAPGQPRSESADGRAQPAILPSSVQEEVERLRDLLALRETAKHYLMKGYALIRRLLVEVDKRFNLEQGVFFLVPEELPRLLAGEDFSQAIAQRRRRRMAELTLPVPAVVFSDDLEAIGRAVPVSSKRLFQGAALSAGVAEGPALVLLQPAARLAPAEPYILVCPSTDPAWVPLFLNARGLVMESGGVLSHGAIVAREFGLPAVAGLPGIVQQLQTGQRLRVDGTSGALAVLE